MSWDKTFETPKQRACGFKVSKIITGSGSEEKITFTVRHPIFTVKELKFSSWESANAFCEGWIACLAAMGEKQ